MCCIFLNTAAADCICSPVHPWQPALQTQKHLPPAYTLNVTHDFGSVTVWADKCKHKDAVWTPEVFTVAVKKLILSPSFSLPGVVQMWLEPEASVRRILDGRQDGGPEFIPHHQRQQGCRHQPLLWKSIHNCGNCAHHPGGWIAESDHGHWKHPGHGLHKGSAFLVLLTRD